jgi:glutathione S-transferase
MMAGKELVVWGSVLSPFTLKVLASIRHAGLRVRLLPAEGSRLENLRTAATVTAIRRGWLLVSYPPLDDLTELPLVPYVFGPGGEILVDSSAIAEWLDRRVSQADRALLPTSATARFAARLIDEFFDEIGLYLAHHNRWVVSAASNDAGARLAQEFRSLVPRGLRTHFGERFSARQVRRLPYLFSVAPAEPERYDVAPTRRPPGRVGFPPTHALLDAIFLRVLEAVEGVLKHQPFLLGEQFSVADASVYGCLGMNMSDPTIAAMIELRAPATAAWLAAIASRGEKDETPGHEIRPCLEALLAEIGATFVPIMRQNEAAYQRHRSGGERTFNEPAFDRGRALFDGEVHGYPFRAVVKTFQVRVWRDLHREWSELSPGDRSVFPVSIE